VTDKLIKHVAIPALAPAALFALYLTPVSLIGCVNRGLLAVAVVLASAAAAFVTVGIGLREQARQEPSHWWIVSTAILTLPLVLILGPLG
jgi:hypothetical protein